MTIAIIKTDDEAQIRQLIDDQASAIRAKDINGIMAHYAPDAIIFDVKPPFQTKGADAWRRMWLGCLPYFPDATGTETRDISVKVSGDLALAHWIWHMTGIDPNHPAAEFWFRTTAGYQRNQGEWQIIHEHCSVPFDPMTSQIVMTIEPE